MKILPNHLLKLRWLLTQRQSMSRPDAEYVETIAKDFTKTHAQEAHPITLMMIDSFYETYKAKARGNHV